MEVPGQKNDELSPTFPQVRYLVTNERYQFSFVSFNSLEIIKSTLIILHPTFRIHIEKLNILYLYTCTSFAFDYPYS